MATDSMFSLPIAAIGVLELAITVILMGPQVVALPIAKLICQAKRNVAVQSAFYTSTLVLAFLFVSGVTEVVRDAKKTHDWDMRDRGEISVIDFLRAQVSCILCLFDLTLAFVVPVLAEAARTIESQSKNMDAMKRQTKIIN